MGPVWHCWGTVGYLRDGTCWQAFRPLECSLQGGRESLATSFLSCSCVIDDYFYCIIMRYFEVGSHDGGGVNSPWIETSEAASQH